MRMSKLKSTGHILNLTTVPIAVFPRKSMRTWWNVSSGKVAGTVPEIVGSWVEAHDRVGPRLSLTISGQVVSPISSVIVRGVDWRTRWTWVEVLDAPRANDGAWSVLGGEVGGGSGQSCKIGKLRFFAHYFRFAIFTHSKRSPCKATASLGYRKPLEDERLQEPEPLWLQIGRNCSA